METRTIFSKRINPVILLLFIFVAFIWGGEKPEVRPQKWAQPVTGTSVKNFFKLDSLVFRSAQPGEKDFRMLDSLGIKEVLNLRKFSSDNNRAKGTGLILHRVKINASDIELSKVIESLKIIKNAKGPILVHCYSGSDRTGLICALYRIVFQNWSKDDAINEMINGGFRFHKILYDGIVKFIRKADIEEIKKAVNN